MSTGSARKTWIPFLILGLGLVLVLAAIDLRRGTGGAAWISGAERVGAGQPAGAEEPAAAETLFRSVRLFDGVRSRDAVDVRVIAGRIAEIGEGLEPAADAAIVDGSGRTLMPGLIDSHTHAYGPALYEALAFGVTTELDMFTQASGAAQLRAEQARGEATDRADLFSAGTLATAPGGHGTEYGFEIPTLSSPEEADAFVEARRAEGSDYLKIVYDGGSLDRRFNSLDLPTVGALIAAAHEREMLAVVHVSRQQDARDVVELGADGIVHVFYDEGPAASTAAFFREAGAFVIPTLAVIESVSGGPAGRALLQDERLGPYVTAASRGGLETGFGDVQGYREALGHAEAAVAALHAAGVQILAGTDAPNPGTSHGVSLHRELELLVAAGLDPVEALAAATSTPASLFGLADRGRIEAGRRADLVLVEGDPTQEITATRAIVAIWKEGVRFDREGYRAQLEAPVPTGGVGLVSSFDGPTPDASVGVGWDVSTDEMMGGQSTASMGVAPDGAAGTAGRLAVSGELVVVGQNAWAGPMLMTGEQPFAPADLSAAAGIGFWARGDAGTYGAMMFSAASGMMPVMQFIDVGPEWQEYRLDFADFEGLDAATIQAFLVTPTAGGPFAFDIDEVALY